MLRVRPSHLLKVATCDQQFRDFNVSTDLGGEHLILVDVHDNTFVSGRAHKSSPVIEASECIRYHKISVTLPPRVAVRVAEFIEALTINNEILLTECYRNYRTNTVKVPQHPVCLSRGNRKHTCFRTSSICGPRDPNGLVSSVSTNCCKPGKKPTHSRQQWPSLRCFDPCNC